MDSNPRSLSQTSRLSDGTREMPREDKASLGSVSDFGRHRTLFQRRRGHVASSRSPWGFAPGTGRPGEFMISKKPE